MIKHTIRLTLKQFEVLEDVLSEIEESRVYEGDDKVALDELKNMISHSEYKKFRKRLNDIKKARSCFECELGSQQVCHRSGHTEVYCTILKRDTTPYTQLKPNDCPMEVSDD